MKIGTVALVIEHQDDQVVLRDAISDETEIELLEKTLQNGYKNPLDKIYRERARVAAEDEEFGDYVEDLVMRNAFRSDIREHAIQWFRSRIKIEKLRKNEEEAVSVISKFAIQVYLEKPKRNEFILTSPNAKVKVKIFKVETEKKSQAA